MNQDIAAFVLLMVGVMGGFWLGAWLDANDINVFVATERWWWRRQHKRAEIEAEDRKRL